MNIRMVGNMKTEWDQNVPIWNSGRNTKIRRRSIFSGVKWEVKDRLNHLGTLFVGDILNEDVPSAGHAHVGVFFEVY